MKLSAAKLKKNDGEYLESKKSLEQLEYGVGTATGAFLLKEHLQE